jgi:hypothetical protein
MDFLHGVKSVSAKTTPACPARWILVVDSIKCNASRCLALLFFLLAIPGISVAANHYVWCGASGTATGADFTNAENDLPASGTMIRGDTYVVAGSVSCTYPAYLFNDPESGTTGITIRKAQASTDSGVAGWQASFATAVAEWTQPDDADPMRPGQSTWRFCRSYYTVDGITGITDPTQGTVGGQGFLLRSKNRLSSGHINVANSCAQLAYNNISFNNIEIDGVDRWTPAHVKSCGYVGKTVTITTAATSYPWVVGDVIGGFTHDLGFGTATFGAAGRTTIATASGQTITFTNATNPCPTTVSIGLNFGGSIAIKLAYASTNSFTDFTINRCYLHDMPNNDLILTAGAPGLKFTNNYLSHNGGNNLQHSNALNDHASPIFAASSNWVIANNYFVDTQGTGAITVFNGGNFSGIANDDGWQIYSNVFATQNPSVIVLGQWITCFGTAIAKVACSHWKIYNNTIYNVSNVLGNSRVDWVESDPSSTDIEVYNNLWVRSNNVLPRTTAGSGVLCLNATAACAATAQMISDYNYYSQMTGVGPPAEVHIQTTGVTPFVNAALNDFRLTRHTADGLRLSAPFNADPLARGRAANGPWDRGAFQFAGLGPSPHRPTSLIVTGVH